MRILELTEGQPSQSVQLTDDEARALLECELGVVSRAPGARAWDVQAGRKVGVARIGDLQVVVRPKIPVDRLVFLMSYARRPKFWRDRPVLVDVESDLVEALAESFRRAATTALEQGLMHGYTSIDEALPLVRGRIRVGEQISRRFGRMLPVEVSYDDFTVDIAENQLLLSAALRLLRVEKLRPKTRHALQRLRLQLTGVTPIARGAMLPRWQPSRLNTRYEPALHLAEVILAGDSFEQRVGTLHASGFVFDMWRIFEDFVCIALKEAMVGRGRAQLQRQMYLDRGGEVPMKPDFLWTSFSGQQVVVDAKYKAEKPEGFPNADLYQLLAYCTVLDLPQGHLVYARGNDDPAVHEVVGANVTITAHTLDLTRPPEELLDQVQGLADELLSRACHRNA